MMEEYKKYLQEIQVFECKTVDPFEIQMTSENYVFGYLEDTDHLQDMALTGLYKYNTKKIELSLKKLEEVRMMFLDFDRKYAALLVQSKINPVSLDDLKRTLFPLVLKSDSVDLLEEGFLEKFYETFLYRLHSLIDLTRKTEDFLVERSLTRNILHGKNSLAGEK